MLEIRRMNQYLSALRVGDLLQEEWTEGNAWLGETPVRRRSEPYEITQIVPGDDGWLSGCYSLPRLMALCTRTGRVVNLLSEKSCMFRSHKFKTDMRKCPYILRTEQALRRP